MMRPLFGACVVAAAFAFGACSTTATNGGGSSSDVAIARVDGSAATFDRARAKRVYERRCGSCHALYAPSSYTVAQWRGIVDEMADMAHLSDEDSALVLAYLTAR
jgi:cytochrome c5